MVAAYLSRYVFCKPSYGVFDEEQLKRYGIFRLAGGYSIDRTSKDDHKNFLKYTRDLLEGRSRLLWVYPQGDLLSTDHVPLVFKPGFASITSLFDRVHLLKILVRYDFWIDQQPEIVISILPVETVLPAGGSVYRESLTDRVSAEMTAALGRLGDIVKYRKTDQLKTLLNSERGTNGLYDAYRQAKAVCLGRPFRKSHAEV